MNSSKVHRCILFHTKCGPFRKSATHRMLCFIRSFRKSKNRGKRSCNGCCVPWRSSRIFRSWKYRYCLSSWTLSYKNRRTITFLIWICKDALLFTDPRTNDWCIFSLHIYKQIEKTTYLANVVLSSSAIFLKRLHPTTTAAFKGCIRCTFPLVSTTTNPPSLLVCF